MKLFLLTTVYGQSGDIKEVQLCFSDGRASLLCVHTLQSHCESKLAAGPIDLR